MSSAKEEWRRRADHIIRLMQAIARSEHTLDRAVEEKPGPGVLVVNEIIGGAGHERLVREEEPGERWSIVKRLRKTGEETVEQTFTRFEIAEVVTAVLTGDPRVQKRQGVGRLLAAAVNIYQQHAGTAR